MVVLSRRSCVVPLNRLTLYNFEINLQGEVSCKFDVNSNLMSIQNVCL